jgi:hypothetical protein
MIHSRIGFGRPLEYQGRIFLPLVALLQDYHGNSGVVSVVLLALLILEEDQVWAAAIQEGITIPDMPRILSEAVHFTPSASPIP